MSKAAKESELAKAAKEPKVNWNKLDVPVEHSGRAIVLPGEPGKMSLTKAIEALQRKQADEEQEIAVFEIIDAYPLDGAVAFVKAMANLYGWASPQTEIIKFFGMEIKRPPKMISVKTGPNDTDVVQCPVGQFKLPGVDSIIQTHLLEPGQADNKHAAFAITATIKKKEKHLLLELANEARRIVKEQSIYRGKPIRLSVDDEGELDTSSPPEFIDVTDMSEGSVLFNPAIMARIDTNILVPIKHTTMCRKQKVPLKRGILLEGPYGTGKSLTARMTAKVAQDNGWTFVLLDRVQGLRAALEFANRYSPAVVFAEDIDRVAKDRDEAANDLVNTIDGVVSKRSEIMVILTTNFAENLNPVILRPGRLDAVISLRAPDAATVERLIRFYAGKLLDDDQSLAAVGKELEGQIPASIRECVERAKLGMIGRGDTKLVERDIVVAAQTMKDHLSLLNRKTLELSEAEKLAKSLKAVIGNGTEGHLSAIKSKVDDIYDHVS